MKDFLLRWSTATEVNNKGFEVERSETNDNQIAKWVKIGYVEGKGTTTNITDYQYLDGSITQSGKYTYRLKQIDYDGSYTYTFSIEVAIDLTPHEYSLSQNYPNPFNPTTTLRYGLPFESDVKIEIFDITGQRVTELVNSVHSAGYYEVSFSTSGLSSGIYFYVMNANQKGGEGHFRQVRKMILLK